MAKVHWEHIKRMGFLLPPVEDVVSSVQVNKGAIQGRGWAFSFGHYLTTCEQRVCIKYYLVQKTGVIWTLFMADSVQL